LDAVNVAVEGLRPEVIAVGETQERLLWVVPPEITPELLRIYNDEFTLPQIAYNARAVKVGTVTKERRYVLRHRGETVMDVEIEFLTGSIRDDLPVAAIDGPEQSPERPLVTGVQLDELLEGVLAHPDVCSREPLYRRYDAVVRGCTVLGRMNGDAGVLVPVPGSGLGVALAVAGNPRYGALDPRIAAELAVYEAVRKVVATGARPIGLTDCLNFGNPRKVEHYSVLVAAIDGLASAARAFGVPFVSGNVSLYNESSSGKAIPASPIVACVGAFEDIANVVSMPFKSSGSVLYLIGRPQSALGASVLLDVLGRGDERLVQVDLQRARLQNSFMLAAADARLLRAAHSVGNGGLATAICEMAFAAGRDGRTVGAQIDDSWQWTHGAVGDLEAYFGEAGGFIVEVGAADVDAFEGLADDVEGVYEIGVTIERPVLALDDAAFDLERLYGVWRVPLEPVFP
jgi:phosphoribosylformylglycinamidine synthase subunit PurL